VAEFDRYRLVEQPALTVPRDASDAAGVRC
jgi:hypothetical protein